MLPNNAILYKAKLHWVIFLGPLLLALFGLWALQIDLLQLPASLILLMALIWSIVLGLTYLCASLVLKKQQLILSTGLFVRKIVDIPLAKIESIDISQSIFGSIFRYGSLTIVGTGGTHHHIHYLHKPLTCRRYIEQLLYR